MAESSVSWSSAGSPFGRLDEGGSVEGGADGSRSSPSETSLASAAAASKILGVWESMGVEGSVFVPEAVGSALGFFLDFFFFLDF